MIPFPLDPSAPSAPLDVPGDLLEIETVLPRQIAAAFAVDLVVAGTVPIADLVDTARRILAFLDPTPAHVDAAARDALARLVHLYDTDTTVHSSLWDEAWAGARLALTAEAV